MRRCHTNAPVDTRYGTAQPCYVFVAQVFPMRPGEALTRPLRQWLRICCAHGLSEHGSTSFARSRRSTAAEVSSQTRTQAASRRVHMPLPLRRGHMRSNQAHALRTGASRHARRRRRPRSGRRTEA